MLGGEGVGLALLVENALINYLQEHVLSEGVLALVLAEVRNEIAAQLPKHEADTAALESELATARAEQKRLAKAIALADDVPELVVELKKRSARIQPARRCEADTGRACSAGQSRRGERARGSTT